MPCVARGDGGTTGAYGWNSTCAIGNRYARVFPDPVCEATITFFLLMINGKARSCTNLGCAHVQNRRMFICHTAPLRNTTAEHMRERMRRRA